MRYPARVLTQEQTGQIIAGLRDDKRLTQQELANMAKLHVATVQRVESGKSVASMGTLKDIAEALGVKLSALLEGGG